MRVRDVVVPCAFALMSAVLTLGVQACGGDGSTEPTSEGGTYALLSINNQALPVTFTGTALGTVVIQNATMNLTPGSPATYTAVGGGTVNGVAQSQLISDAGTYVRTSNTINFTSTAVPLLSYAGALNGSQLSVSIPGVAIGVTGALNLVLERR